MTKVIIQDKSVQPLEACSWGDLLFCHSFLIVPKTPASLLGHALLSQLKAQVLLPTVSYLCCPFLQKQRDSTVWTDECRVSQDGPLYSNKTQKSLTVSTPKTISPQA
jgi:hypothetical protein